MRYKLEKVIEQGVKIIVWLIDGANNTRNIKMQDLNELRQMLLDAFEYRDGHLYWKKKKYVRKPKSPVGRLNKGGYRNVTLNYKCYYAHRITFLMHHGYLPKFVDHIDGNKDNNKIENLRAATQSENLHNSKRNKRSTTGHKGVKWSKQKQKFIGIVRSNYKEYYAGAYNTIEEAAKATIELRNKLHGAFAKHN